MHIDLRIGSKLCFVSYMQMQMLEPIPSSKWDA